MLTRRNIIRFTAAILILLLILAEGYAYSRMNLLPPGNSANFWEAAAKADLPGKGWYTYAPPVLFDGHRCIYVRGDRYFSNIEIAHRRDVLRDFPAVLRNLAVRAANPDRDDYGALAYNRWIADPAPAHRTPERLAALALDARFAYLTLYPAYAGVSAAAEQAALQTSFEHARRLWLTCLCEIFWLALLILLFLYPLRGTLRPAKTIITWMLFPFLLLAPAWLGFVQSYRGLPYQSFGGILYRVMAGALYIPHKTWENNLLNSLPHPLTSISQVPFFTTGRLFEDAGPLSAIYLSAALLTVALILHLLLHLHRRRKRILLAFEVLPGSPQIPMTAANPAAPPASARSPDKSRSPSPSPPPAPHTPD